MTSFIDALETKDTLTENGMPAHSTTGGACVDLFFKLGATRALTDACILGLFHSAWKENQNLALKCLFYNRDVRGGQGERRSFRTILRWLAETHPGEVAHLVHLVPEYGRWDDLHELFGTTLEGEALRVIEQGLLQNNALCAKWTPRKGPIAEKVRRHLGMSPRDYRKFLVARTQVVESKMTVKAWSEINYSHVPSKAANLYKRAFARNDAARYGEYLAALLRGDVDVKVNASAIFPHDILQGFRGQPNALVEAQWKAQPNYLVNPDTGTSKRILPVCDVSGSMSGLPMEVCVALGIYLAERNEGPFKDRFITFSDNPVLERLVGATVFYRQRNLRNAPWGGSTNLEAVWKLILAQATQHRVPEEEMPTDVIIFSDMQFNHCVEDPSQTALEMIRAAYAQAGYKLPNVWFWNLRATDNVPVKHTQSGVALVSGFSPSILSQVLSGKSITPEEVMRKTLLAPRYEAVTSKALRVQA